MWKVIKIVLWAIFALCEIYLLMNGEVMNAIIVGGIVGVAYYFWKKDANEYDRKVASGEYEKEQQQKQLELEEKTKQQEEKIKMKEKENEMIKKAKNVLIECEGNIYKAIKQIADEYALDNETAEKYIHKAQAQTSNAGYTSSNPIHLSKCPTCGSTNIEKIGMVGKIVSVELFGLASNSIGKTYKCNHCGYKW